MDKEATLQEILRGKEERVLKQQEFLSCFGSSLISLSINIPGAIKLSYESLVIYEEALEALHSLNLTILHTFQKIDITGAEAIFAIQSNATSLKMLTCNIESTHPLGRFMDIDVLDFQGNIVSRKALGHTRRKCYLCDNDAFICGRAQKHSLKELQKAISHTVKKHALGKYMAQLSYMAMKKEVELTPKPGLVDSNNSGAHQDMDIHTFYASMDAIKPYIEQFTKSYSENAVVMFENLRLIGIACEKAMFNATKGVNTHKGMIFCLAIVCGAIAKIYHEQKNFTCKVLQEEISILCGDLVDKDLVKENPYTAGARFFYETGSMGIRGEAQSGFSTIFEISLPFFINTRMLLGEEVALKQTLLKLMSKLDDSTLWSRGGIEGLVHVKSKSLQIGLHVKNNIDSIDKALHAFDEELISLNLSPGGSADLLALTWLISHIVDN
ncbi:MAG: triphosphoribosyl-dephospho-CoA synthase CitG [Campylobacteraceae bacterium]|nr:triphosphoribosyl-dephospho-CoA synthase CitG [Campylobacteraceae bacterium]